MLLPSLVEPFIRRLDPLGVPFMVTGSVAGGLYGDPRVAHDIDIVIALPEERVGELAGQFPGHEFYCPPEHIIALELQRDQDGRIVVIDLDSGFKADIYFACDQLHRWALSHVRRVDVEDLTIPVAPAEYVIIRKLAYFRDGDGSSHKHLRDIQAIVDVRGNELDRTFLDGQIERRGLQAAWAEITIDR